MVANLKHEQVMKNAATAVRDEIEVVRKAWRLTRPETDYRDPMWLKSAASVAAKAGRLPKRGAYGSVINQLHGAGYHRMIDHVGIIKVDGERHVIFEPYESRCSMDTARRMANELAEKLQCRAWVSLCSWHVPGATIRITLAPLHDVAPVVANPPIVNRTPSQPENSSVGQQRAPQRLCHSGTRVAGCDATEIPQRMGPPARNASSGAAGRAALLERVCY